MRVAHKTALIRGGNNGIGQATARQFLLEGARVGAPVILEPLASIAVPIGVSTLT
jgi:NAD(P)-dependent dehydrogenase (short-subunit alcohol dehydrogenase family)